MPKESVELNTDDLQLLDTALDQLVPLVQSLRGLHQDLHRDTQEHDLLGGWLDQLGRLETDIIELMERELGPSEW